MGSAKNSMRQPKGIGSIGPIGPYAPYAYRRFPKRRGDPEEIFRKLRDGSEL
jgi:hypothetical protein